MSFTNRTHASAGNRRSRPYAWLLIFPCLFLLCQKADAKQDDPSVPQHLRVVLEEEAIAVEYVPEQGLLRIRIMNAGGAGAPLDDLGKRTKLHPPIHQTNDQERRFGWGYKLATGLLMGVGAGTIVVSLYCAYVGLPGSGSPDVNDIKDMVPTMIVGAVSFCVGTGLLIYMKTTRKTASEHQIALVPSFDGRTAAMSGSVTF